MKPPTRRTCVIFFGAIGSVTELFEMVNKLVITFGVKMSCAEPTS